MLVAGIGNIFLGDDGWGVEVVTRLARHPMPDGVRVADFGIRGVHLAFELLDGYDIAVLVDAVSMGEAPGTVAVLEPDLDRSPLAADDGVPSRRRSQHESRCCVADARRSRRPRQPRPRRRMPAGERSIEGIGLSDPVARAVDEAVELCRQLVDDIVHPVDQGDTQMIRSFLFPLAARRGRRRS